MESGSGSGLGLGFGSGSGLGFGLGLGLGLGLVLGLEIRVWLGQPVRAGGQREHCRAAAVPRGGPHRAVVQRRLEPVLPARRGRAQRWVPRACEPQPPAEDFGRASER